MPTWNPALYLRFAEQRTRPCRDLAAAAALESPAPRRIVDLGCGPGNSTAVLAQRWPEAEITGLDSSTEMIAAAQKETPRHRWLVGDIATWTAKTPVDLVFSNAALHWVPDHAALYPRLFAQVAVGGALAIQVPNNHDGPAQRTIRELAASPAWHPLFPDRLRDWHVEPLAAYYDLLAPLAKRLDIWESEYIHILPDTAAIVEWYKGTGLRPYLDALPSEEDRARFLADYGEAVSGLFPAQADGNVLFPFRRLFLVAYK